MPLVRMDTETHRRLQVYADGRPLGRAVARLLDEHEWVLAEVSFSTEPGAGYVTSDSASPPLDAEGTKKGAVGPQVTMDEEKAAAFRRRLGRE